MFKLIKRFISYEIKEGKKEWNSSKKELKEDYLKTKKVIKEANDDFKNAFKTEK